MTASTAATNSGTNHYQQVTAPVFKETRNPVTSPRGRQEIAPPPMHPAVEISEEADTSSEDLVTSMPVHQVQDDEHSNIVSLSTPPKDVRNKEPISALPNREQVVALLSSATRAQGEAVNTDVPKSSSDETTNLHENAIESLRLLAKVQPIEEEIVFELDDSPED
jgi:hypothetical protein